MRQAAPLMSKKISKEYPSRASPELSLFGKKGMFHLNVRTAVKKIEDQGSTSENLRYGSYVVFNVEEPALLYNVQSVVMINRAGDGLLWSDVQSVRSRDATQA